MEVLTSGKWFHFHVQNLLTLVMLLTPSELPLGKKQNAVLPKMRCTGDHAIYGQRYQLAGEMLPTWPWQNLRGVELMLSPSPLWATFMHSDLFSFIWFPLLYFLEKEVRTVEKWQPRMSPRESSRTVVLKVGVGIPLMITWALPP